MESFAPSLLSLTPRARVKGPFIFRLKYCNCYHVSRFKPAVIALLFVVPRLVDNNAYIDFTVQ